MRKYCGATFDENHEFRTMFATVTGQMDDGTLVWTECDGFGNLIDIEKQYRRTTSNGFGNEFVRI